MRENTKRALGLSDLDPHLADLARDKEAQVRQTVTFANGFTGVAIAAARAAASQQAVTQEGQAAIESLRAAERADDAIRVQAKKERRGLKRYISGPSAMMLPVFLMPFIMMPMLVGKSLGWSLETRHLISSIMPFFFPLMVLPIFLQMSQQNRRRKTLVPEVLRAVLPAVAKTAGERAYAGAAVEICDAQTALGLDQAREMLVSLNSLLENERRLEAQKESIDRAMNVQTLQSVEAERDRLQERLQAAKDPTARETLVQSLELCEGRLAQAQRLAPARERIDAQQESIRQVMASVRTSLAGLGVASAGVQSVAGPQAEMLRETTVLLQSRARAVEQALEEVAAISAGR